MAKALVLEFDGVGKDVYDAVNAQLGIDTTDPGADWPEGLSYHVAGSKDGGWVVMEVWESEAAQAAFMNDRLGAALQAGGAPMPSRMLWVDVEVGTKLA